MKNSPATVKMTNVAIGRRQTNSSSLGGIDQYAQKSQEEDPYFPENGKGRKGQPLADLTNRQNQFSCFILRSEDKSLKKSNEHKQQQPPQALNLNQRLEEIEADAQALKRSMLDNSSVSNNQMDSEYRTNVSSQERMLTSGDP